MRTIRCSGYLEAVVCLGGVCSWVCVCLGEVTLPDREADTPHGQNDRQAQKHHLCATTVADGNKDSLITLTSDETVKEPYFIIYHAYIQRDVTSQIFVPLFYVSCSMT